MCHWPAYREGLKSDGGLATLDADAADVTEADMRGVHDPAVKATIGEQWDALGDDSARLVLRLASLFPESSAVPIARLGLLADLGDQARPGRLSPLRRAVKRLDDACLVERFEGDRRAAPSADPRVRRRSDVPRVSVKAFGANAWNGRLRAWSIFRHLKRSKPAAASTACRRT